MSERNELPVVGMPEGRDAAHEPEAANDRRGMDRRMALKVMALVAAAPTVFTSCDDPDEPDFDPTALTRGGPATNPKAAGTATDPDLIAPVVPWERTLSEDELAALAVLCDVIIPADEHSPAASTVGAHEFIDEWVSAPYDGMQRDRVLVLGGLVWLDRESARRFGEGRRFRDLATDEQHAICDDIASPRNAQPGFEAAARFFDKLRDLTATAFYTTREGMDDLGYVGNVPLASWGPPPPEALRHLGLDG
ncbi:MAG: gluconate 2-dehydrogenase subunit 3 family protein [Longimicrobiales bacterium]|nr:gluconate 2-dehydrogenase subunit 3 family protein [Longimicrobiales bacterium]